MWIVTFWAFSDWESNGNPSRSVCGAWAHRCEAGSVRKALLALSELSGQGVERAKTARLSALLRAAEGGAGGGPWRGVVEELKTELLTLRTPSNRRTLKIPVSEGSILICF